MTIKELGSDQVGILIDLHGHSRHSTEPTNWVRHKFPFYPESLVDPKDYYRKLKEKGMSEIALTDHNEIQGCLDLNAAGLFCPLCAEITGHFLDGCKVHVLVYEITVAQYHKTIELRFNIYGLVRYLRTEKINHALAHPLYSVNNLLTADHVRQLLVLFDFFEINGARSEEFNQLVRKVVREVSGDQLEAIAQKFGIKDALTNPLKKFFIGGSDDHSGLKGAKVYTWHPGKTIADIFSSPEKIEIIGQGSVPMDMAQDLYSILYQKIKHSTALEEIIPYNEALQIIDTFLDQSNGHKRFLKSLFVKAKTFFGSQQVDSSDFQSVLISILTKVAEDKSDSKQPNHSKGWFELVSSVLDESIRHIINHIDEANKKGDIFEIMRSVLSLAVLASVFPIGFYLAYFIFHDTRLGARKLAAEILEKPGYELKKLRVAHLTDTFHAMNGVSRNLQQMQILAEELALDYKLIICDNQESQWGEKVFPPVASCDLPFYPEVKMIWPPMLEMLEYFYQQDFTHIHVATPASMGLFGLGLSTIFKVPLYITHHTALPQYIRTYTEEPMAEDAMWKYLRWFYRYCDKIFVPSLYFRDDLIRNAVPPEKIVLVPKGVDTERFQPGPKPDDGIFRLLYVGRISSDKDLPILVDAFKLLNRSNIKLIVVGDGPYREKMEKKLRGFPVEFTGYLEGAELVQCYQKADLFVFPSTKDTFGNVVLESHACGLPIIVTDIGGPKENVRHGFDGFIVEGLSVYALRDQIIAAIALDKEMLQTMGKVGRKEVEKRTFKKAFEEFLELYDW